MTDPNESANTVTLRELFAGMALIGSMANAEATPQQQAVYSRKCADALIAELNKEETSEQAGIGATFPLSKNIQPKGE